MLTQLYVVLLQHSGEDDTW